MRTASGRAPLDGGDVEILRQLILPQEEEAGRALRQYEFCLKNILNGAENDSRQYDRWERNLLETATMLDEERRTKIEGRVRLIRKAFFPVIESNLYRDYKANDEIQIRMLPFILTGQFPVHSLAVSFANPASAEEKKECLMANIAAVDILSPKQLYYLNYIQNDAQADAFLQNLRGVFAYLDRRAIRREVFLCLVLAKEGGRMERELKAYMRERGQSGSGAVNFVRYELCVCESESLAAKQFAKWLKEYDVRWLDDSAPLFEARKGADDSEGAGGDASVAGGRLLEGAGLVAAAGMLEDYMPADAAEAPEAIMLADTNRVLKEILTEEDIAAFRFDRKSGRFTDCRGCRELLYIEDSSYIRIDDYQALTGKRVEPCAFPEYENDCEVLWNLYETAPDAWETLCGMLTEYESSRPVLAVLQIKAPGDGDITGEAGMTSGEDGAAEDLAESHTCFLPNYTYRTVERLLAQLKAYGVIGENSSVCRYASDTCMLNVICEPATWQELYSVLRKPQQLIDYYGVTAVKGAESDTEIRIVGNPLEVREMKAVFREADAETEYDRIRELLEQLQDAGYILDLYINKNTLIRTDGKGKGTPEQVISKDAPERMISKDALERMVSEDTPVWSLSFSYSSLRIKELLTTRGALQAVQAYYEILKSGCVDDVRYIKPVREGETMGGLTQAPEVLFSKGYQIFQEKVR